MRIKKIPAFRDKRETGSKQHRDKKILKRPLHITTIPKVSKQKLHWSRLPEQRRKNEKILAMVGLRFEPVYGTFHRLSGIGGQDG